MAKNGDRHERRQPREPKKNAAGRRHSLAASLAEEIDRPHMAENGGNSKRNRPEMRLGVVLTRGNRMTGSNPFSVSPR